MSRRTLVLLMVVAVVAAGIAWLAGERGGAPGLAGLGEPLLPGLREHVNDVAAVSVQAPDGRFTARRGADGWTLDESDGYPAKFETVKKTLLGLSELRTLEAKTSNPARHAELGLEDPESPGATSVLVTLLDGEGRSLGAVVVGRSGSTPQSLYARRAADAQCWLVKGSLYLERSASQWMDRLVYKLPASRVRSVTIEHADGERVRVAKAAESDADWSVLDVPADKEPVSSGIGRTCAAALEFLNFDKVASAGRQPLPAEGRVTATFESFDGLVVTVTSARVEPAPAADAAAGSAAAAATTWITLSVGAAEGASEAVQAEARSAQERLAQWSFAVPDYAAGNLRKHVADLLRDVAPPEEEGEDMTIEEVSESSTGQVDAPPEVPAGSEAPAPAPGEEAPATGDP